MFTGLIETIATVSSIVAQRDGKQFEIAFGNAQRSKYVDAIGDSVAINGVCLSVTTIDGDKIGVHAIRETLEKSSLNTFTEGMSVNIESACRVDTRLGGHIVQGHVDCVGKIVQISNHDLNTEDIENLSSQRIIEIKIPHEQMRYIVEKGSISLDGVSLTVSKVHMENDSTKDVSAIEVCLIPLTWKKTTFASRRVGDIVNVEVDVLSKYVHNACQPYISNLSS